MVGVLPGGKSLKHELENAGKIGHLHLSQCRLVSIPSAVFETKRIVRLDVSHNNIAYIPHQIGELSSLRELWLHHNPIVEIPASIGQCSVLEVVDLRKTLISDLPPEICLLGKLFEMDWRGCPLEGFLHENEIEYGNLQGLIALSTYRYKRLNLRSALLEQLSGEHFAHDSDKPNIEQRIESVVDMAYDAFPDLDEFALFVRRVDKLLPHEIDSIHEHSMSDARVEFQNLRDETTRKRLAADVEIKLRAIYFDMVEPPVIERMLKSIYDCVSSLPDIQFLVKYAKQVMPEDPMQVEGSLVWDNILTFQAELTSKRNTAIGNLANALSQLYPEQEAHVIREKAEELALFYQRERFATTKELNTLSQLTAEVGKLFPPDFMGIDCKQIIDTAASLFKIKP
jgi:Leucine-rich repeat (LRR) protein